MVEANHFQVTVVYESFKNNGAGTQRKKTFKKKEKENDLQHRRRIIY